MSVYTSQKNGALWLDTDGGEIHAHGGWILRYGGKWWWYGEDRRGDCYVSCYVSDDLLNWRFVRHSLTVKSKTAASRVRADLTLSNGGRKVNIERPKVMWCEKTRQLVMWAHYENGADYSAARACVAVSDTPDGDFTYLGSFNPFGEMSRDCTVFEDRGKVYFISASRDNADLAVCSLQDDYLNVSRRVNTLFSNEYREAPALFSRGGKLWMLSSFCTGWAPNQGKYSSADTMEGEWSALEPFGDEVTYRSQPAFVLPVPAGDHVEYLYFGDRWLGDTGDYFKSGYVVLPLRFDGGRLILDWHDSFDGIKME